MVSMPLVVDLDGTLIRTDMLHESALRVLRDSPGSALRIPLWLSRGKALLKERLAGLVEIDPASLPYNTELLEWLKVQKSEGRKLILCTASDKSLALAIAEHLTIFDEVMASDGVTNLAGPNKAAVLHQRFGQAGFDYVGNSSADIAVWRCARNASWSTDRPALPGLPAAAAKSNGCSRRKGSASRHGAACCGFTSGSRTCCCSCRCLPATS